MGLMGDFQHIPHIPNHSLLPVGVRFRTCVDNGSLVRVTRIQITPLKTPIAQSSRPFISLYQMDSFIDQYRARGRLHAQDILQTIQWLRDMTRNIQDNDRQCISPSKEADAYTALHF